MLTAATVIGWWGLQSPSCGTGRKASDITYRVVVNGFRELYCHCPAASGRLPVGVKESVRRGGHNRRLHVILFFRLVPTPGITSRASFFSSCWGHNLIVADSLLIAGSACRTISVENDLHRRPSPCEPATSSSAVFSARSSAPVLAIMACAAGLCGACWRAFGKDRFAARHLRRRGSSAKRSHDYQSATSHEVEILPTAPAWRFRLTSTTQNPDGQNGEPSITQRASRLARARVPEYGKVGSRIAKAETPRASALAAMDVPRLRRRRVAHVRDLDFPASTNRASAKIDGSRSCRWS